MRSWLIPPRAAALNCRTNIVIVYTSKAYLDVHLGIKLLYFPKRPYILIYTQHLQQYTSYSYWLERPSTLACLYELICNLQIRTYIYEYVVICGWVHDQTTIRWFIKHQTGTLRRPVLSTQDHLIKPLLWAVIRGTRRGRQLQTTAICLGQL